MSDLCWLYVSFMLVICQFYVGYMSDLCRFYVSKKLNNSLIYSRKLRNYVGCQYGLRFKDEKTIKKMLAKAKKNVYLCSSIKD